MNVRPGSILLFTVGFLQAIASSAMAREGCGALLLLIEERDSTYQTINYDQLLLDISDAEIGGVAHASPPTNRLPLLSALRRHYPLESGPIIEKMNEGIHLEPVEAALLRRAATNDFRIARHELKQMEKPSGFGFFLQYAPERLSNPIDEVDRTWKESGFNWIDGNISGPTYGELSKNLDDYQERMGISPSKRIKISVVHQEPDYSSRRYRSIHSILTSGEDIATPESVASNKDYIEAILQNFVIIERDMHDIGHAIGWISFPDAFEEIKKLGALQLKHPEDTFLLERFRWASELMTFGNPKQILHAKETFMSAEAWMSPSKNLGIQFQRVKKEVEKKSPNELRKYAEEVLLPRYRSYFSAFGGGQAQYGETELKTRGYKDLASYAVNLRYNEPNGIRRPSEFVSPYLTYMDFITMEEPRGLEFQLREILSNPSDRENRIVDMVSRMEFAASEYSSLDPSEVIRTLRLNVSERKRSKLARIIGTINGENSALYQIITQ
jgi:hypothetical protein